MKNKITTLVTVALCAFLLFTGCSNKGSASAPSQSKPNSTADSVESTESKPAESEPPKETNLAINDSATLGDWEIIVTDAKVVDSIAASYGSFIPDDGNKYIQVFISISNNGKKADTFLPIIAYGDAVTTKLIYGEDYEFSSSNLFGYDLDLHNASLNPLSTKEGELAFTVPDKVAGADGELLITFKSGNDDITFKIR